MFELRLYRVAAGRQHDEVERMYRVAIAGESVPGGPSMFDRYGIPRPLGAWTAIAGQRLPLFGYLMKWDSLKQRDACFPPFWADPSWRRIRDATDDGSPLVERIDDLIIEPSSAARAFRELPSSVPPEVLHELRIDRVANGFLPRATQRLAEFELPRTKRQGAHILGVFNQVIGPDMPAVISFFAWPSYEAHLRAATQDHIDADIIARDAGEVEQFGTRIFLSREQHLLTPVAFGVPSANCGVSS